ncbi:hypothetical protein PR048_014157 [Dryococelus australis]|uniref:Uncharacterized protein n=1 Tax=Dryococelus australis TaxID=614101 RepID=A0ABQ9HDP8_9NEOP|nr:hypothetical protein PR048_014157 [Dryococelus australis]
MNELALPMMLWRMELSTNTDTMNELALPMMLWLQPSRVFDSITDPIPGQVTPGFPPLVIVPDNAAGRRVFSGILRFPRPCIPALLRSQLISRPQEPPKSLSSLECRLLSPRMGKVVMTNYAISEGEKARNEPYRISAGINTSRGPTEYSFLVSVKVNGELGLMSLIDSYNKFHIITSLQTNRPFFFPFILRHFVILEEHTTWDVSHGLASPADGRSTARVGKAITHFSEIFSPCPFSHSPGLKGGVAPSRRSQVRGDTPPPLRGQVYQIVIGAVSRCYNELCAQLVPSTTGGSDRNCQRLPPMLEKDALMHRYLKPLFKRVLYSDKLRLPVELLEPFTNCASSSSRLLANRASARPGQASGRSWGDTSCPSSYLETICSRRWQLVFDDLEVRVVSCTTSLSLARLSGLTLIMSPQLASTLYQCTQCLQRDRRVKYKPGQACVVARTVCLADRPDTPSRGVTIWSSL